ncbi:hypothetical protein CK203_076396 [Vitis vinifera]|uniref:Uncharacterized protein n=1 Tax=Vitis vinifera TaxID=29760 RepID=A0A438C0P8_VITVI|nr:hypothetical protein CK203_076396 [Vitis vinifera]
MASSPVASLPPPTTVACKGYKEICLPLLFHPHNSSLYMIQDEVGASPVEIARAYMGTRTSEIGLGSKSIIAKDERTFLHSDDIASNPFIASPSPKPPICWPGAMVQDQRSYLTPQGQRSRLGVNNFPRTPYSRTIFSKPHSKSTQSQADSSRHLNTPSTPLLQSQSPIFEQVCFHFDNLLNL